MDCSNFSKRPRDVKAAITRPARRLHRCWRCSVRTPVFYMSSEPPIVTAAYEGDIRRLRKLLKKGVWSVNSTRDDGASPLYMACRHDQHHMIKPLLEARADIDLPSHNGLTPLYVSCRVNAIDCVRQLIAAEADVNKATSQKGTPLFICAQKNHPGCALLLLHAAADVNLADVQGATPLHMAAQSGFVDMTGLLCAFGADKSLANEHGFTPLMLTGRGNLNTALKDTWQRTPHEQCATLIQGPIPRRPELKAQDKRQAPCISPDVLGVGRDTLEEEEIVQLHDLASRPHLNREKVVVCPMTEDALLKGRVPVRLLSGEVINVKPAI